MGQNIIGLGREAHDKRRTAFFQLADGRQNVGVFGNSSFGNPPLPVFLILLSRISSTRQSATAAAAIKTSAGKAA